MIPSPEYSQNMVQNEQNLVPLIDTVLPGKLKHGRYRTFWQMFRFGIVGLLNTSIDFLTYSLLTLCFTTHDTRLLVVYNTIAFLVGAVNSFLLNKYWTFRHNKPVNKHELLRFAILTVVSVLCNNSILWISATLLHPLITHAILWADTSKAFAIVGTTIISYVGMRLWVFSHASPVTGALLVDEVASASEIADHV